MTNFEAIVRRARRAAIAAFAAAAFVAGPAMAQIETIDPNSGIDADLNTQAPAETPGEPAPYNDTTTYSAAPPAGAPTEVAPEWSEPVVTSGDASVAASQASANPEVAAVQGDTYKKDDLIGAAEGVFGKGAEGLARMIEDLLAKQGEPNAYIIGREAGGAFVVGARYGSGTLHHKVEGQKPVYWTGPSIGFDAGANAGNTFVLVYNLYDTEELYERFPAGEGAAYVIGGLNASYVRKGDVVLIPIRVGAGLRLGVNAGYLKFSKKQRWLPF
ncbi:DUF1134 domain-containing protein [Tsuneonella amylolytica]|uniref:DUF1134 domain-containing protein n=1 Tax=Tsuneonella amylolytica TaxID=2338327 RepID=UPI001892B0C3|nr:DUF1134 domain-containing protein [Tsuneonella amylolytica]